MIKKLYRPWGWYENLEQNSGYKIKKLYIEPNKRISLQYHNYRDEHWIVVSGNGKLELNNSIRYIQVGDYIFVPSNSKHRVSGGVDGITIVEVQLGKICDEEDIVRIQDDYGRI